MSVTSLPRRFVPAGVEELVLPPEVLVEIERALDIAEELDERGVQVVVRRPGAPRRLRIDLKAQHAVLCELGATELLELGAGRLQLSQ